jgi:hypothetical protein
MSAAFKKDVSLLDVVLMTAWFAPGNAVKLANGAACMNWQESIAIHVTRQQNQARQDVVLTGKTVGPAKIQVLVCTALEEPLTFREMVTYVSIMNAPPATRLLHDPMGEHH